MSLDSYFKFKIGQIVRHKIAGRSEDEPPGVKRNYIWASAEKKMKYMIRTRVLEECVGGLQMHYHCRGVSPDGGCTTGSVEIDELELVATGPFEYATPDPSNQKGSATKVTP